MHLGWGLKVTALFVPARRGLEVGSILISFSLVVVEHGEWLTMLVWLLMMTFMFSKRNLILANASNLLLGWWLMA